jgi:hypothetical protein
MQTFCELYTTKGQRKTKVSVTAIASETTCFVVKLSDSSWFTVSL